MPFLIAFGLALALTPLALRAGLAGGFVDRPDDPALAIHSRPVPVLGGLALIGAALAAAPLLGDGPAWSVIAAALVALATGLADDVRPLPPLLRLAVQGGAGALLAADGLGLDPLGPLAGVGVAVLVVACANAVNMVDGQNGLAGGVIGVSAVGLALVHQPGSGARSVGFALAGGAAGFLVWNVPGRIFLGNGGAYAAGAMLAALAATATTTGWRGSLAAAACLGILAFESLFTITRRIHTGAGLMTGDRLHSYDIVADRTSRLRSTIAFWAAGAAASGLGVAVTHLPLAAGGALLGASAVGATFAGMRIWGRRRMELPALEGRSG